ncbi:Ankyrin repeat-containing protein [Granulicella rosea]|uniref:Ankyrin repeat-containing protein n=1 Tax=Granulicella rosea TaxID=474952 RepID=A0A239JWG0_9BACT|nr:ankyrin repeat domain-containing protein [Granulicella rosea]SNT09872.1 Ankyrin repeat-containing protein [Granulicella rosea]
MSSEPSLRELPARPSLEHLKHQARTLQREGLAADALAIARFAACGIASPLPKLADALHVIAREYGFATWPALKLHVEVASEDPAAALAAALKALDAKLVRQVLARHPQLRATLDEPLPGLSFDTPALVFAAMRQSREIVEALLEAGASIDQRTRWWAGSFGALDFANPELSAWLIARGATVDIHAASRLGLIDRVRELLAADPQLVHARGGDGQLPLHFAATVEIAALLLDHGAELDARDIDHESTAAQYQVSIADPGDGMPRYREAGGGHMVARYLVERGAQTDLLMLSALGDLARVEAILNEDPECVRMTVSERFFPKRDPKSGGCIYFFGFGWTKSPQMLAHQFGHTAVYDLLMQRSPLWLRLAQAAEVGDEPLVERIVQHHPTLCAKLTPAAARRLVGIAVRGNTRALAQLLALGWPADARLENNQTALHYAAWHGNLAMVRDLLAYNAPVNVFEAEHGGSPLGWTLHGSMNSWLRDKGDYPAVAHALLAAGAQIPKPEGPVEAAEEVLAVIRQHTP